MMMWSRGSPRIFDACTAMLRFSFTLSWPTKSTRRLGRREESRASSSSMDFPETSLSVILYLEVAGV